MQGYDKTFYNKAFYGASTWLTRELSCSIKARVVKPLVPSPPIMDTIARGLAKRFDWLGQGIQVFGLFGKIEYATGNANSGLIMTLDDWGEMYELPRLPGENDEDYRLRLQTYINVLNGSGTIPNARSILDFIIGVPGGSKVSSLWPARVMITFDDVTSMRSARTKLNILNSVLPGMFAAGTTWELIIPYLDVSIRAAILGTRTFAYPIRAAVQTINELLCPVSALVAYGREIEFIVKAAIQGEMFLPTHVKAAIKTDRWIGYNEFAAVQGDVNLPVLSLAAVQGDRELGYHDRCAVMADRSLDYITGAAVAKTFEFQIKMLAFCVGIGELPYQICAAIQSMRQQDVGIRARIARPAS